MNRSTFLKSLFLLAASPKVLAGIKTVPKVPAATLLNDLQLLTPNFYKEYLAKYGNENFVWWMSEFGKTPIQSREYFHFETGKTITSNVKIGEPITITLTKENFT